MQRYISTKNISFSEESSFNHFRTLIQKVYAFCQFFFRTVIKTALYVSIGSFWRTLFNFLFCSFFVVFGRGARKYPFFVENFLAGFSRLHSTYPEKSFDEFFFEKRRNSFEICEIKQKAFGLWQKKTFFLQGCQNCNLRVYREVSGKTFFFL